jgi:RNA-directed DNA polymerase
VSHTKASPSEVKTEQENECWEQLPWRKLEKHVFRLQTRIYKASQKGNVKAVHKLQKLLMKSRAARLIAVRRVTQDNQGKKTAGIDGVKSVKPQERLELAKQIDSRNNDGRPQPVRRVWIPKPGKDEKRPLGIPTMLDRGRQALTKLALEPEWEAKFEPNSYGFRPGRSGHDAIEAIFLSIKHKSKFVFDADIKGCFDNIDQEALLQKLATYPFMRRLIKGWLKAGVIDNGVFDDTKAGTPQGGVISPLLANIALHGMEDACQNVKRKGIKEKPILIRYADDYVIIHSNKEILEESSEQVITFLKSMGLWLNTKKTRITQTLIPYEENVGFEFLGFTVRQFPAGKHRTGTNAQGQPLGFQTVIRPSKEARKRHMSSVGKTVRQYASAPQETVIAELNPKIRGWATYYRTASSSKTFAKCDNQLWAQLWRWSVRRHPNKGRIWVKRKYWQKDGNKNWAFNTPDGKYKIRKHKTTKIQRHTKVKGTRSPYDGDFKYWSQRLSNHPMLRSGLPYLLKKQKGKCRMCNLHFKTEDLIEIDHITPRSMGGGDEPSNLMALHKHCHIKRHQEMTKAGITL